jgi:hypothetical protein
MQFDFLISQPDEFNHNLGLLLPNLSYDFQRTVALSSVYLIAFVMAGPLRSDQRKNGLLTRMAFTLKFSIFLGASFSNVH